MGRESVRTVGLPFSRQQLSCISHMLLFVLTSLDNREQQEGIRYRAEPAEPNRLISEPAGTRRGTEPNRTEPRRVRENAGRTASNREQLFSEPNRTEPINFRKVRNRNESNRIGSFLHLVNKHVAEPSGKVRSFPYLDFRT